jgi:hypothetical protein
MSEEDEEKIKTIRRRPKRPQVKIPPLRPIEEREGMRKLSAGERSALSARKAIHNHFWTFVAYKSPDPYSAINTQPEEVWANFDEGITPDEAGRMDWQVMKEQTAWATYWDFLQRYHNFVPEDKMADALKGQEEAWREQQFQGMVDELSEVFRQIEDAKDRLEDELESLAEEDPEFHEELVERLKARGVEIEEAAEARRRERFAERRPITIRDVTEAAEAAAEEVGTKILDQMQTMTAKWTKAFEDIAKRPREEPREKGPELIQIAPEIDWSKLEKKIEKTIEDTLARTTVVAKGEYRTPPRELRWRKSICESHLADRVKEFHDQYGRWPNAAEKTDIIQDMFERNEGIIMREPWLEQELRSKWTSMTRDQVWTLFPQNKKWWSNCPEHRSILWPTSIEPLNRIEGLVGKMIVDGIVQKQLFVEEGIPEDWVEATIRFYRSYRASLSREDQMDLDTFWKGDQAFIE